MPRYIVTIRANSDYRAGKPPRPDLMAKIAQLGEEAVRQGKMVFTGGLAYNSTSTRIDAKEGKLTVTDGPFTETKELIAGFAIFDVASKEEMVEQSRRFMQTHIDVLGAEYVGACEIHEVFSPPDVTSSLVCEPTPIGQSTPSSKSSRHA